MEGGGDWEDGNSDCSSASHRSTGSAGSVEADQVEMAEVERLSAQKTSQVLKGDAPQWRQSIRDQMETELERRVREALATPPQEKLNRRRQMEKQKMQRVDINAHLLLDLTDREQNSLKTQRWKALQAQKDAIMTYFPSNSSQVEFIFRDELSKSNQDEFPGVFGLESFSEGIKNIREDYTNVINRYGSKPKTRHFYTKEGFLKALRTGNLPSGVQFLDDTGRYVDKYVEPGDKWRIAMEP
nr:hypothetical protein BaRGS_027584 [Batillaria attramentaria]